MAVHGGLSTGFIMKISKGGRGGGGKTFSEIQSSTNTYLILSEQRTLVYIDDRNLISR